MAEVTVEGGEFDLASRGEQPSQIDDACERRGSHTRTAKYQPSAITLTRCAVIDRHARIRIRVEGEVGSAALRSDDCSNAGLIAGTLFKRAGTATAPTPAGLAHEVTTAVAIDGRASRGNHVGRNAWVDGT